MLEIARTTSELGVKRIYYKNSDGLLVERLLDDTDVIDEIVADNIDKASQYRPHAKADMRQIARIPDSTFIGWLMDAGVPGYCDQEAIDFVVKTKLKDPAYKYLLTVPENYRI